MNVRILFSILAAAGCEFLAAAICRKIISMKIRPARIEYVIIDVYEAAARIISVYNAKKVGKRYFTTNKKLVFTNMQSGIVVKNSQWLNKQDIHIRKLVTRPHQSYDMVRVHRRPRLFQYKKIISDNRCVIIDMVRNYNRGWWLAAAAVLYYLNSK